MALRETCLWEQLTPGRPDRAALKGEVKVDVCVIGAGITGLSAAIHLLEQGKTVAVLEAHRTGHGGSGRNVGLVNAGLWIPPDEIEAGFGEAVGSQLNRMLGAAPSLVFSLVDKYNIDCQLRREGTLHMAHNARGEADLRSREEQWKRRGAPVELLTGSACEQATGTQKISAALLDRRAGTLNPMAYTSGLANAAVGLGGQLFDHSPVARLERQGAEWSVQTANGAVQAAQVVIASNAYTEGEWTELRRNFFPGYYYQVASAPLTDDAAQRILPVARVRGTRARCSAASAATPMAACCSAVWATATRNRRGFSRRGPIGCSSTTSRTSNRCSGNAPGPAASRSPRTT